MRQRNHYSEEKDSKLPVKTVHRLRSTDKKESRKIIQGEGRPDVLNMTLYVTFRIILRENTLLNEKGTRKVLQDTETENC